MAARRLVRIGLALVVSSCSGSGSGTTPPSTAAKAPAPATAPGAPGEDDRPLPSPLPGVAARVNGQSVLLRNVAIVAEPALKDGTPADERPQVYRRVLGQLIIRELLFQEAVARKLTADDKRIEQAYNEARVPYKADKDWATFLAKQGLEPQGFRDELRTQYTIKALFEVESRGLPAVTDQEAESFYRQNPALFESGERLRASHILVRVKPEDTPARKAALRAKAEGILARVRRGEGFAPLARKASDDPGSAGKGGRLDEFAKGQMVPAFEQAAFALKPGEISGVVESPFGFHVIKLHDRLPSQKATFAQLKDRVKQQLAQQRQHDKLQGLVNALRAKAKIESYL